nr:putative ADP-glucose pyrophosphorylase small subunit [Tanacetum cinerariifolium]
MALWDDIGIMNPGFRAFPDHVKFIEFYDHSSPIYTQPQYLPPSKMLDVDVTDSVIGEGCVIKIINSGTVLEAARDTERHFIKSGIVTVIKDASINIII